MDKVYKKIISPFCGKIRFQGIFWKLYLVSLEGMNIGRGADFKDSGEIYVMEYVRKHLENLDNIIVFDVGANNGDYSIWLSKIFGENAIIHSFEPSKYTFNKLKINTEGYDNICIHNIGISNENSGAIIYSNLDGSGLASVYKRRMAHYKVDLNKEEYIEVKKIDTFCEEQKIDRINFLKLDIEGHEFRALEGASEMLKLGKIDFIQFEFGQCNIDSRFFFQDFYYLFKDSHIIYRILKNGLYQVKEYKETYELFRGTTNYLAVKK
ncbi:MAG: FkbM family methyltransferase [Candidatus Falkowbacteria bacterium]